ncbi:preprotein translocase subunit YajC [Thermincola ferriacetica]|uniref:Preprotein translocase, YajC subunit n=2 Tax=Thermincola TaxID=278993 RepID=D5XEJ4_THEPJ|nr:MULTISPECIES: preprotein translocase subunit YajC [Thermincola]ADG82065.1 preprotein translocase, YajC subunit [Thermincola potens JR]KNZ71083.1 preprotein translocase subunit YajC [Thermincola ferriacetica]
MKDFGPILYLIALLAIFYFMIIRPQQQRQKKHQQLINSLQENTEVTTIGGILGTIVKVKDKTVILKIADNVKIEILKTAIAYRNDKEEKK